MQRNLFFRKFVGFVIITLLLAGASLTAGQQVQENPLSYESLEENVKLFMEEGNIPGATVIIIQGDKPAYIKGFGYADLETKKKVTPDTLFEMASCSKSYTALAILKLERDGLVNLDDPVSKYLPWFSVNYKEKKVKVTIRQVLHQTSGIPFKSITKIPRGGEERAIEQTVKNLVGYELKRRPGRVFEYATINYDIIGALIEEISGMSYQDFMVKNIFRPLGLNNTRVGVDRKNPSELMASGYKISFSNPTKYVAPELKGNDPAGYIISDGRDVAAWLRMQMNLEQNELTPLMMKSQQRDATVAPQQLISYAMGWQVSVNGNGIIEHSGMNPNFSTHFVFNPRTNLGVAVLANSNSDLTKYLAYSAMVIARGDKPLLPKVASARFDKPATMLTIIMAIFITIAILFILYMIFEIFKGHRKYDKFTFKKFFRLVLRLLLFGPFVLGVYFLPGSLMNVDWKTVMVWSPFSFQIALLLILVAMAIGYIGIVVGTFFPHSNKYKRALPLIIVLSLLSGFANSVVIFLITGSIFSTMALFYQIYNFLLAGMLYIGGRKVLQTKLLKLTYDIVFDTRMALVEKIFYTTFQSFERLNRGRVLATLNDDTGQIGNSAQVLVTLVTSSITAIGAFIYLSSIAFWATMITLAVVFVIALIYIFVARNARDYLEKARDTRDEYMGLLNGMIDGFKELSMQYNKRKEYKNDLEHSSDVFRIKLTTAFVRFLNAFLIGESMLILILGAVGFGIPRLFPDISTATIMSFIMVLLYLIGPINGILQSIPNLLRLRVAWDRVKKFMKEIPANIDPKVIENMDHSKREPVESIVAKGVTFRYETTADKGSFTVGPIDFEAQKGEIVFIVGGNGSGKTTFAKLLAGLYIPKEGSIKIDGKEIDNVSLGEYYSTVYSDYHLFSKLYNVSLEGKKQEIAKNLKALRLLDKVVLEDNAFSTLDLSGGQRKRLALLQCYLEDNPIFLFDEIAADQDPNFRKFFYRELLPEMKEKGKIVIAITHDDHYFDVADRVLKLDMGKVDSLDKGEFYQVTS